MRLILSRPESTVANGNVLRDVIVVTDRRNQCFHWGFQKQPRLQIDQQKSSEKPRQSDINFSTITNQNKFTVYTSTVLQNVLVNCSCSQRLPVHQHSMSFVLNVVLMWSRISFNNDLLSDLQPCCSMAFMCCRRHLFLQLVWQVFDSRVFRTAAC